MVMAHLCLEHPQEALEDPNAQRGFERAMLAGWFSRIQKMNKHFGVMCVSVGLGGTEHDVELSHLVPNFGHRFSFCFAFCWWYPNVRKLTLHPENGWDWNLNTIVKLVAFWGPAYFQGLCSGQGLNHPGRRWFRSLDLTDSIAAGGCANLGTKCFKRWKVSEMKICWFDNKSAPFHRTNVM